MGDEQAETLEQRVEREASEARARWIGDAVGGAQWAALDEPERVDWRDVVRPLVERNVEAGQMNGALIAAARQADSYARGEIERLKGALADAQDVIERADEQRRRMSADLVSAHGQHMRDKTDLAEARTTVDVLAGRIAARGQS